MNYLTPNKKVVSTIVRLKVSILSQISDLLETHLYLLSQRYDITCNDHYNGAKLILRASWPVIFSRGRAHDDFLCNWNYECSHLF